MKISPIRRLKSPLEILKVPRRAIFLDRDGTLNEDPGYLNHPDLMKLLPQVGEALAELRQAGYLLVVVSNQSGIGRGVIDPAVLPLIHRRLDELLKPWGVQVDRYELCIHRPEDLCQCRKPKPKLILEAAKALGVDVGSSYMVGDKGSDLEAGVAAGCRGSILVRTGEGQKTEAELEKIQPAFIGDSLVQVANWILSQESVGS